MPLDNTGNGDYKRNSHMNTSKTEGFEFFFYGVAASCVLFGVILNFSDVIRAGTFLIMLGIILGVGAALRLGHLKRW